MSTKALKNICNGDGYNIYLHETDIYYTPYLIDNLDSEDSKRTNIIFPNLTNIEINENIRSLHENFYTNFIDNFSITSNMCSITSINNNDSFLYVNFISLYAFCTDTFLNNINNCFNSHDKIFIPVKLIFNEGAHSNLIIVDKFKKTIYFYEPHGVSYKLSSIGISLYIDIESHIIEIIKKNVFKKEELLDYKLSNTHQLCTYGPQYFEEESGEGFCLAWSLLFVHLILLNDKKPIDQITSWLSNIKPDQLNCYIKKYTSYLYLLPTIKTYNLIDPQFSTFKISLYNTEIEKIKFEIQKYIICQQQEQTQQEQTQIDYYCKSNTDIQLFQQFPDYYLYYNDSLHSLIQDFLNNN